MPHTSRQAATDSVSTARRLTGTAALVLLGILVLGQVIRFDFVLWDDQPYVVHHLRRVGPLSLDSVAWSFGNEENGWRTPIPYLSLISDLRLYGLDPAGFHLTNLMIHLLTVVVLFDILLAMTRRFWPSWIASALFAVHPLHVEPVAWVTGRWELLCGMFWVLGMLGYQRFCHRPTLMRLVPVMGAYILALASKPMALTFPFALLLLDYWPLNRLSLTTRQGQPPQADEHAPTIVGWQTAVREKLPLFGIMLTAVAISYVSKTAFLQSVTMQRFTWAEKIQGAVAAYAAYIADFVWPIGLSFYYPHAAIMGGFNPWRVLACALLLAGISAVVLVLSQRRALLVGWLWFLGTLVPAIGLVQVEHHARADRYMYIPLIGLLVMVCWGIPPLLAPTRRRRVLLTGCGCGVVLVMSLLAWRQTSHWRDSEALFRYALQVDKRNFKAEHGMGSLAYARGEYALAERHFARARNIYHGTGLHDYLLARTALSQGSLDKAMQAIQRSLVQRPDWAEAHRLAAEIHQARGDFRKASQAYHQMLRHGSQSPDTQVAFGEYLFRQGKLREALRHYRQALILDPHHLKAPLAVGETLKALDRPREAREFYRHYVADYPHRDDVAMRLARMLCTPGKEGDLEAEQGLELAMQVCERNGSRNARFLETLSLCLAANSRFEEAEQLVSKALELARSGSDEQLVESLERRKRQFQRREPILSPCAGCTES